MDNQVNLSYFNPVNVHLEILLKAILTFTLKIIKDFTAKGQVNHDFHNCTKRPFTR